MVAVTEGSVASGRVHFSRLGSLQKHLGSLAVAVGVMAEENWRKKRRVGAAVKEKWTRDEKQKREKIEH